MPRSLACLLTVGCVGFASSQPLTVTYDKLWGGVLQDAFRTCVLAADGTVYIGGLASILSSNRTARIIKYNPNGTVAWSRDLPITGTPGDMDLARGPLGLYCAHTVIGGAALRTFVCRINESDGSVVWQATESRHLASELAVSSTSVACVRFADTSGRLALKNYLASTGAVRWDVLLPASETDPVLKITPSRDFILVTKDSLTFSSVVRKISNANGAILWTRTFLGPQVPHVAVLSPSGNVAYADGNLRHVEVLNGSNGLTIRQDATSGLRSVFPVPSVDDGYLAYGSDPFFSRVHHFDRNGYLLAVRFANPRRTSKADGVGPLFAAETERNQAGLDVLRVFAFGPIGNVVVNAPNTFSLNDFDVAGDFVAACGDATITSTNQKGRVVLLKAVFSPNNLTFPYRRGRILSLGAPGFLASSGGAGGAAITLGQPPSSGSLTLGGGGAFSYTPNVGFHGNDSFAIKFTKGATVLQRQYSLVPLKINTLQIEAAGGGLVTNVVGGTSCVGSGTLSTSNPFADLIIQNTDTIPGLAPVSSVKATVGGNVIRFNIVTSPVADDQAGVISCTLDGAVTSTPFEVRRARPIQLTLSPTTVAGFERFTGTVVMNGAAPPAGYSVSLTQSGTAIIMPSTIQIPSESKQQSFAAHSFPVTNVTVRTISATSGGTTVTAQVTVNPGVAFVLTASPLSLKGGSSGTCTITIDQNAPPDGLTFSLSAQSGITVPTSATILPNGRTTTFNFSTATTATPVTRTITASSGVVVRTVGVSITP